jgi:hypothetical protein
VLTFDHLKLIRGDLSELARYRRFLLGQMVGDVAEAAIAHEANNSCCLCEPWNKTLLRLHAAIKPPVPAVAFNLNRPGTNP